MLNILISSFIIALICAGIPIIFAIIIDRKDEEFVLRNRIIGGIVLLLINFWYMIIVSYVNCYPTVIISIMYIWPCLLIEGGIIFSWNLFLWKEEGDDRLIPEWIVIGCITIILIIVRCLGMITPIQNLTYVHDMEKVDITYAIPSDEILAKIELKVDDKFRSNYYIESPEMREVKGKNIAVYKVGNIWSDLNGTEYIPGYFIQEEGELPKLVTKRIYYDTTYIKNRDTERMIRRKYPTVILGEHKFDIDDDWNPYEVYVYREKMYSSNGKDYGLIILNLKDGTSSKYPAHEGKIPSWVDFETNYPR